MWNMNWRSSATAKRTARSSCLVGLLANAEYQHVFCGIQMRNHVTFYMLAKLCIPHSASNNIIYTPLCTIQHIYYTHNSISVWFIQYLSLFFSFLVFDHESVLVVLFGCGSSQELRWLSGSVRALQSIRLWLKSQPARAIIFVNFV